MTNHQHELRARLETRLAEIVGRIERIGRDLRRAPDRDWADEAILQENDEVLEGLDELERAEAVAIRATLRRIETGDYGICGHCGQQIETPRLAAVPTVDTCMRCAT